MVQTNNLNVRKVTPIIAPENLKQVFPLTVEMASNVSDWRARIKSIMRRQDPRLMVVIGPCSIHDPSAAMEYARRLAKLNEKVKDQLFIVMRVYFEKPRTTIGWKGLINDPDLNGTHQISKGLGIARQLFCSITDLKLPIASEMLDPITPQYLADIISWGAIGARTTESQTHREMASGLSFPVGFKNGTDGGLQVAIDAMGAAIHQHSFLGMNYAGRTAIVETAGNPDVHIVLRGGSDGPNYFPENIRRTEELLAKNNLLPSIMVDCSHANSDKDHTRQQIALESVVDQVIDGNSSICSVMIESNLGAGNQKIPADLSQLKYGVSITDKCIDWETTETLLLTTCERLSAARR
ncbi:MAG: 3-deoxy-7-phosphoheptulonate synthase [Desulfuromonas sp.]|mgnify:CR=1 FL=1|nr:MAG: 3-deoxy-7-phosphoheptulonate synthase [Desulfuromonas sp.]